MMWILLSFTVCTADVCAEFETDLEAPNVVMHASLESCTWGGRVRGIGVAAQGGHEPVVIVAECEPVPSRQTFTGKLARE